MKAGERPNHPVELLSASIDGEIRPAEAAALEAHLEGCVECRGLLEDFRKLEGTIADEAPPAVPAELRERILAGLTSRPSALPVPFWRQALPLAAAASLLMGVLLWLGRPDRLPPLRAPEPVPAPMAAAPRAVSPPAAAAPAEVEESQSKDARAEAPPVGFADRLRQAPAAPPPPAASRAGARDAGTPAAGLSDEPARREDRMMDRAYEELPKGGSLPRVEAKPSGKTEATEAEVMARLRSLGYTGSEAETFGSPEDAAASAAGSSGSAAGNETGERAPEPAAQTGITGQLAQPVTKIKAAQATSTGLFAPPYTVRLVADRRMLVQSGPYACTAAVEDSDRRRIAEALQESERMRPREPQAAAPRADAVAPVDESAAAVVPATPEAREVILRLVRERYRRALESRCGPLPN